MGSDLSIDDRVIAALRRILRAIDLHSRQLVEHFGVTGPQLMALQELARVGSVPVGLLARQVHVSHPTMTGILARLEKRGFVERARDTSDRRKITVRATEQGYAVLSAAPSPLQNRFLERLARLEEWEQTQILSTLQRIAAMMDAEKLDAAPMLATGATVAQVQSTDTDALVSADPSADPH